ncbi:MAG: Bug family tripartite tricarboxylate transporter substrate binding protein [Pseudorhodoplanes sp.]|uniref:Bug family tripartite tricarboxylate transporter substrate binding protein n=1 Tax=Pseudorhodoplanes sp. TaxID=1934341 RepID=UPI003D11F980
MHFRTIAPAAAMAWALAISSPAAQAQSFPTQPLRIVVPLAPGGPIDLVARAMAENLSASLKQPVVVENKPGAAGNIGAEAVAKSAPDGHTLLSALGTTLTVNPHVYAKMPVDMLKDLKPVLNMASTSQMLVVHPSVPVNSLAEFIALAKKEPMSYAHAGHGSPGHLAMEYFRLKAGLPEMTPVPYRGNAPLVTDLISGQVKVGFVATAGVIQHVRGGRLKGFAVSSKERSKLAPDVPTIAESGYPDFNFLTYFILLAPSGVPDAVLATLESEARKALVTDKIRDRFANQDVAIIGGGAKDTAALIKSEYDLWADVAKAAKMKID